MQITPNDTKTYQCPQCGHNHTVTIESVTANTTYQPLFVTVEFRLGNYTRHHPGSIAEEQMEIGEFAAYWLELDNLPAK